MELVLDDRTRYRNWSVRPYRWYVASALRLLRWNSHETLDDDILMALPELYRYGREGHWFSMKLFLAYMMDGILQVRFRLSSLPISSVVTTFAVGNHFLPHPLRLLCTHLSIGWL